MTVNYGQYVAVCIVSIAYSAFGESIARNSAHSIIEYLTVLTACVGDLLADVQLVVLISFGTARNGGLVNKSAHIVIGVVGSAAERSGKTSHVAKQIVSRRAYVVCCVANLGVLTARVVGVRKPSTF